MRNLLPVDVKIADEAETERVRTRFSDKRDGNYPFWVSIGKTSKYSTRPKHTLKTLIYDCYWVE